MSSQLSHRVCKPAYRRDRDGRPAGAGISSVPRAVPIFGLALFIWGCAAGPAQAPDHSALFYPSPPAQPRLQFLTRLSSQRDLAADQGGFKDFVFGQETTEGHLVRKPYGLALHDGKVFVVDTRNSGYGVFDLRQRRTRIVQAHGGGVMKKPINITIDADGTRYVTDTDRNQVLVFDREDKFLRALGRPDQFKPVDVAVSGDRLYVTDLQHHEIQVLDKYSGDTLFRFGEVGSEDGQLFQPTNLALGRDASLFVSDTGNFRIQKFSLDGEYIRTYGQIGTALGRFARPKGVAVDDKGRLYIVDAAFENIQILDSDGSPLLVFGQPGDGRGHINLPTAIKIDYDNVDYFRRFAAPGFELEYVVLVASQFGVNKVVVFGFGEQRELESPGEGSAPEPRER